MAGIKKTLGGDRIGSEEKMKLWLHDYESSTHDISRVWRSSIAPGVLYPFMAQLVEDGDVCEIDLRALARTIPTVGPLFGSFKLQIELYHAPFRLYNGLLHNNAVKIGLNMAQVKFPKLNIATPTLGTSDKTTVNPSSILHYMKICELPNTATGIKKYNAVKFLAYYDIIKNYHINKQESYAYIVGGTQDMASSGTGTKIGIPIQGLWQYYGKTAPEASTISTGKLMAYPQLKLLLDSSLSKTTITGATTQSSLTTAVSKNPTNPGLAFTPNQDATGKVMWLGIQLTGVDTDLDNDTILSVVSGIKLDYFVQIASNGLGRLFTNQPLSSLTDWSEAPVVVRATGTQAANNLVYIWMKMITYQEYGITLANTDEVSGMDRMTFENGSGTFNNISVQPIQTITLPNNWANIFKTSTSGSNIETGIASFPIENFDKARWTILKNCGLGDEVRITGINTTGDNVINYLPYSAIACNDTPTEQDLNRNKIPMNGLMLKCYLSDIFNNWLDTEIVDGDNGVNAITSIAVTDGEFTIDALNLANRVYNVLNRIAISGGTYEDWREAVFGKKVERRCESPMYIGGASGEVTFEEVVSTGADNENPLGTLAGKGTLGGPLKGGYIRHYCEEAGYIIGIVSLTPRIDYSQGVDWDNELDNFDQLHKPGLDCIGFQNLMASWMNGRISDNIAVGKQPAWIQYQTAVNEAHGDFADENKAMYMTLNRRFETEYSEQTRRMTIKDATTYIDPSKYNYAFADAAIDSQNFWLQIGVDFRIRRLMSANQIPNL